MADLQKSIEQNSAGFSKGQRIIAEYILENYDKAAFMTAAKLGQEVGISESTVVRFAYELGFDGYPSLQRELKSMVRNKLTTVRRMKLANEQLSGDDVVDKVLSMDISLIRDTVETVSRTDFNRAVDAIINARTIYIIGSRSASALAAFLGYYFNFVFQHVRLITTNSRSEIFEQIMRINSEDVLIGISFPRYSAQIGDAFKYTRDSGAKIIAITDSHDAPIAANADYRLIAQSGITSFVDSLAAPLSLINALIVAVGLKKQDTLCNMFNKLENIWDEYEVYGKQGENNK